MLQAHKYSAWFLYFSICTVYLLLALEYPAIYVQLTYEDMYGEWMQTWLFAAVCIMAIPLARLRWAYRWFFVLLGLAAFYTVMEEISWGQRLLQIDSPAFFARNNVQGEINLHNFFTGPESTLLKDVVEYTLASSLVVYGLFYPVLLRYGWGVAHWLNRLGVVPPPLYLWMFFVGAAFFEIGWFKFNEAEVAEILVGTALVLMLLRYRFAGAVDGVTGEMPELGSTDSMNCGRMSLDLFIVLMALAYATTTIFLSFPGRADGVEERLANGYEKFARRMEDGERWHDAAELYRYGFELGPQNLPMLHKALANYQIAGDTVSYDKYYRVMLSETAADVLRNNPSAENLLMLATNYAGVAEQTEADEYIEQALAVANTMIVEVPAKSDGYYWLGRVYQQRGDYGEAKRAYQQAQAIEPGRSRNILALRKLQLQVNEVAN
jgi:tetratricopeptide (TPR) repeat protein